MDKIRDGVGVIKNMAEDIGREIDVQGNLIEKVDDKVEKVNEKLENINRRMKATLEKVRKGDRFLLDCVLIIICISLAGLIYSVVSGTF